MCNEEEWKVSLPISDPLAQVKQRLAQILPGVPLRSFRPEQRGPRFPAVQPICFDDQIGQQGSDLV